MYFTFGGCSTLFHLMVRNPILVLVLGLAGFTSWVQSSPNPGDAHGTASYLASVQANLSRAHPELVAEIPNAAKEFEASRLEANITEEQVKHVLGFTDACTDVCVQDIMKNVERRKEAAWLFFLDERLHADAARGHPQFIPPRR